MTLVPQPPESPQRLRAGQPLPYLKALDYGPWPQGIVPVSEQFRADIDEFLTHLQVARDHVYTDSLHVPPLGALLDPFGRLVLPFKNILRKTTGMQIRSATEPPFDVDDSQLIGNGLLIGDFLSKKQLAICVDWPSGVAVHLHWKCAVLVVFEHRNLQPVVDLYRRVPGLRLAVFGDRTSAAAQVHATRVARTFGCALWLPDLHQRDFHAWYIEEVLKVVN